MPCRRLRMSSTGVLLALLAVLGGCRLGVDAEVTVDRDGSGRAAVEVRLDRELLAELDRLQVDPTAELTAATASAPAWDVSRRVDDDGALVVAIARDAADPASLTDALRELTDGLAATDPALLVDLDLEVDEEGAAVLEGSAQLRPPAGPGVEVDEPERAEFERFVRDHVDATLTVRLPGPVTSTDADERDGSRMTWSLTPGDVRRVAATSAPAPRWTPAELAVIGGAALLVVLAAALVARALVRRR